tara:strand:- start:95 stop:253 length:159 start_codon:yes stop_codon:yes gene_type:complete
MDNKYNTDDYLYIKDIGYIKIPPRNTKDDILKIYNFISKEDFIELMESNIIK